MTTLRPLVLLWFAWLIFGCASPGPELERPGLAGGVPWTGKPVATAPDHFKFLVVTDRTGEHRHGVFAGAIDRINLLAPAFVVSVGDLVEGYTEDPGEIAAQWDEVDAMLERLDAPFFYAAGNHDFSNEAMARDWHARRGPSYYHFLYQDVLFLVLNSEIFPGVGRRDGVIGGPDVQADQLAYAREVLAAHRDARWTFVVIHRPLWDRREVHADWLAVEEWLGERPYTVLAGHRHRYTSQRRHDHRYVTLATTGGGSRMRGIERGEFDHVALVSVGDGEPVIANLMLDGIHGVDVRTEDTRARVRTLERAIRVEPLRASGARFQSGTARFRVRNDGDEPLLVTGRPQAGPDLAPGVDRVEAVVASGEEALLEIPVRARTSRSVGALAPSPVRWRLAGRKADGTPLVIEETSWLLPDAPFACRPVRGVRVDGRLDDWEALPFAVDARPPPAGAPEPADGPSGASLHFGVGHDERFLYVAARVVDPTPSFHAGRTARDQDAVQITLDARPAPARDTNTGFFHAVAEGSMAKLVIAWLLPGESRDDPLTGRLLPELPDGARRAARTTEDGYAVELAIPLAFLDERQGQPWQGFRLNVALQDFAADGHTDVTHWWRPSRFGMSGVTPVAGAGTFVRSD